MAHEITELDQVVTRETPWHGLGITLGRHMTSVEALELSNLGGWDVGLTPLWYETPERSFKPVEDAFAVLRRDTGRQLGVVGSVYTPIQNEELFAFADGLVDSHEAWYESAGSLRGQKVVFTTMLLDRPVVVADVDFKPYLTVASSHDGSIAFQSVVSPTVVVCMNTLRLAINGAKHSYYIKHTDKAYDRIAYAREALRIGFDYYDGFEAEVQTLIDQKVTNDQFEAIVADLFPSDEAQSALAGKHAENRREGVRVAYHQDPAAAPFKGTGWGTIQAVNTWELWSKPVRLAKVVGAPESKTQARLERQALGLLRGDDSPLTSQAHRQLKKLREEVAVG